MNFYVNRKLEIEYENKKKEMDCNAKKFAYTMCINGETLQGFLYRNTSTIIIRNNN